MKKIAFYIILTFFCLQINPSFSIELKLKIPKDLKKLGDEITKELEKKSKETKVEDVKEKEVKSETEEKEVKSETEEKEVKSETEEKTVNGLKTYCDQAKSQEGKSYSDYFKFTKLEKFNFMDGTNLKIMNVDTKDWSAKLEFLINKELGKGKAKLTLKNGNDLIQNFSWTMLNEKTLAVFQENVGGSAYKGQDVYLFIYSFKNEKDLNYVICEYGGRKMGEVKSATYTLEKGITKAEYANTPEGKLLDSYKNYILIKGFYEARKQYAVQYVSSEQFSNSRSQIKAIDEEITKNNNVNSDEVWNKATQWYKKEWASTMELYKSSGTYTQEAAGTVKIFLMSLNSTYNEVVKDASTPKKDF